MPVYKLDLVFESNGYGWMESYYKNFSSDFSSVQPIADTLATKRAVLSSSPVKIEAYKVSDPVTEGNQGESIYFAPPKVGYPLIGGGADVPTATINIAWRAANNLRRRSFFRGVWDGAVTQFGQLNSTTYGQWLTAFLDLRSWLLQEAFGWYTTPRAARARVSYSYVGTEGFATFNFPAGFWPAEQEGTYQRVRFSRFNNSDSPLNIEMSVFVTGPVTAVSAEPRAAGPMISQGQCIRYGPPQFVVATNIGVERAGRRAPGRPLLRTPGRSRERPVY